MIFTMHLRNIYPNQSQSLPSSSSSSLILILLNLSYWSWIFVSILLAQPSRLQSLAGEGTDDFFYQGRGKWLFLHCIVHDCFSDSYWLVYNFLPWETTVKQICFSEKNGLSTKTAGSADIADISCFPSWLVSHWHHWWRNQLNRFISFEA